MAEVPQVQANGLDASLPTSGSEDAGGRRPSLTTRKSSSLHKNLITKLRPLPFQYVWAVWHEKSSTNIAENTISPPASPSTAYDNRLTLLAASVPDIAAFYRIWNNFPWDAVRQKDCVHVFRQGVKPLWEDEENLDGGCWVLKVRKDDGKSLRAWEEVCLMGCGGELQASVQGEHDHILGISFSPRLYWVHITIWNKQGSNTKSIQQLETTVLERLSPELRPSSNRDYYYKKHSDHEGWKDAVKKSIANPTKNEP